jgi:hypothetical protein
LRSLSCHHALGLPLLEELAKSAQPLPLFFPGPLGDPVCQGRHLRWLARADLTTPNAPNDQYNCQRVTAVEGGGGGGGGGGVEKGNTDNYCSTPAVRYARPWCPPEVSHAAVVDGTDPRRNSAPWQWSDSSIRDPQQISGVSGVHVTLPALTGNMCLSYPNCETCHHLVRGVYGGALTVTARFWVFNFQPGSEVVLQLNAADFPSHAFITTHADVTVCHKSGCPSREVWRSLRHLSIQTPFPESQV